MSSQGPGAILFGDSEIELNTGRPVVELEVRNTGDRAVQVGSHYHFFETNAALDFEREAAFGMRLDIPSGTAVRFEAGQTHTVRLIPFGGGRKVLGFHGLGDAPDAATAMDAARAKGLAR